MSMVDRFTRHASLTARRAAVAVLMALLVIPFVPATVSADPIINAPNLPCVVLVGNPGWVNPPTATDDGYSRENGNLSDPTDTTHFSLNVPAPGVLGNDSGGPSGWFAALYTGPAHASQFQLNSDGSFHYVPTAGYLGGDSFTYVRYVNGGVCSTGAIVTIAPATSLRGQDDVYVAYRDTTLNVGNIAGELAICSFPGICGVLNNDLLLQPVNPLASPGTYINPVAYIPHGVGVPANGIVTETHSFPVGVAYATPHGVVDLRADGSFSYTPEAGFTGTDYFGYSSARSQDDWGVAAHVQELVNLVGTVITWDWNIVRIDVVAGPAQSVPQGVNDAVSATEDTTTTINAGTLLANDVNANFITYVQSTNSPGTFRSDHGTVAVRYSEFFPGFFNSIRVTSIDYTPDPNYNGPDRFTYNVASTYFDGHWNTTDYTGTVILNVAAAPDPPIANGDFAVTNFNQAITVDAIANDSDADGDLDQDTLKRDSYPCFHQSRVVLSCIGTDDPSGWTALAHGTWQPHADGTITYTPAAGFIGEAVYPYEICDIAGACDHESISVAVRSVADDPYQTPEDTTLTVLAAGVLANDKPGETAILGTTTQHGALTLQSTGAFTYVPAANFHGTDSFTYRISSQETATVTIEVGSVNDAPDLVLNHYCDRSNVNVVCLNGDVRDIAEGGTAELNGFIKDPEFDGGTLTITWGDGATTTVAYPCAGATCPFTSTATFSTGCIGSCGNPLFFHLTHVYADDPSGATEYFSIGGSAVEADDTTDTASTGARVLNVAPDLTISPEGCDLCLGSFTHLVKNTGELASVAGRVIDLGLETGTLTIDWGDGSAPSTVTMGCGSPTTLCVTTSQHSPSCGTGVSFGLACGFFSVPHTYLGGGTFTLQVTADDGDGGSDSGQAAATITGEAIDTAPSITSANSSTFTVGSAGSFTVTTTGHPTASLAVQGALPSGITFTDNGNGTATLAGTPAAGTGGDHAVTISADNDVAPNASQSFTLHVRAAPAITSASNTTFTVGSPGSFTVTTSGVPTATLTRTGTLPSGISFIDNGDGTATLGGTPAAGSGGDYPLSFSAANGVAPNASQSFTLHVRAAPAVTSANSTTFTVGSPGSFTVTTTGVPVAAITEAGSLPAGITFTDNGNGTATLAGTPAFGTGGDYSLTLTANNGVAPNATQTFTLRVQSAPAITSASSATFTVGSAGSFTVTATGFPTPALTITGGTLPAGVTFTDNGDRTATLAGTPSAGTSGDYPLTISAANGVAPSTNQSFNLHVSQQTQTITFEALAGKTYGAPDFGVSATATSGLTVSFTASPASVCTAGGTNGATISIVGVGTGTCSVTAHQAGNGSWLAATDVTQTFSVSQKAISVPVTPASVQYSDPAPNLNVKGTVSGLVGSDTLAGTLTGCTASGLSTSGGMVVSPAGSYVLSGCTGLSNANYVISYSGSLTVGKESVTAEYGAPNYASTGSASATKATVTLTGQLTQDADGHLGDLTKATAQFLLYNSANVTLATPDITVNGTVNASGVATGTASNLAIDTYTVILQVTPANTYFGGPQADADMLTVFQPATGTWVSGGGWLTDPSYGNLPVAVSPTRPKGHFGFDVSYGKKTTTPKGHASYSFRGADGYVYVIKSTTWQGGALTLSGAHGAWFAGKANVVAIDPITGLAVPGIGGGNFSFRVDIVDGSPTGSGDTYALSVYTAAGALYHQVGTAASPIAVKGGNLTVHAK